MKIVLSRKGFDSQYGGYPSPIFPDGRMVSLPIPSDDEMTYGDLKLDEDLSYYDLMRQLNPEIRYDGSWHTLTEDTRCHLDPDIRASVLKRPVSWKPLFGQVSAAQTHLRNEGVGPGDVFVFFGTFKRIVIDKGNYRFDSGPEVHVIYGYLQIFEVVPVGPGAKFPEWMRFHPHTAPSRIGGNNTIYVARDSLSWQPALPGAGPLKFNNKLILTKPGYLKSRWQLPDYFKNVRISYHADKDKCWKDGYFQSRGKGQEFVIHSDERVENWLKDLLATSCA